ncbi:MAG: hypothetical protein EHM81_15015 [Chloroflexi bacterium]|nr:MAG: hypothetical protein EHM81_15015 [Chloroflexota bacterium]
MSSETQEIILTRIICAPAALLYAAFTTAEDWCAWCCEKAEVDARLGGKLHIHTDGYNAYGEFKVLEENQAIAFTWDGDKEPPTRIHISFAQQGAHTTLTFKVVAMDFEGWTGPEGPWTGFMEFLEHVWGRALDNLKTILEAKPG